MLNTRVTEHVVSLCLKATVWWVVFDNNDGAVRVDAG